MSELRSAPQEHRAMSSRTPSSSSSRTSARAMTKAESVSAMSRRRHPAPELAREDADAALATMFADELREIVRAMLLELDDRAYSRVMSSLIHRAARSGSGWAPAALRSRRCSPSRRPPSALVTPIPPRSTSTFGAVRLRSSEKTTPPPTGSSVPCFGDRSRSQGTGPQRAACHLRHAPRDCKPRSRPLDWRLRSARSDGRRSSAAASASRKKCIELKDTACRRRRTCSHPVPRPCRLACRSEMPCNGERRRR